MIFTAALSSNINPALSPLGLSVKGLMESWSNVSGNYCDNRRNSCRSDTAVHRSSALLLQTPGISMCGLNSLLC